MYEYTFYNNNKIKVESSAGVAKKKLKNSMNKERIQNSGIH